MNAKQWVLGLSLKTKIIIAVSIVAIIITALAINGIQNKIDTNIARIIESSNLAIEKKNGEIKALLSTVALRDSINKGLSVDIKKKDDLLAYSESRRKILGDNLKKEMQRQSTLTKEEAYRLFLKSTGGENFKGGTYDSSYLVPIESIWNANGSIAENSMLAADNKELQFEAQVYRSKIVDLNNKVKNLDANCVELKQALTISDSKSEEYLAQIKAKDKAIKKLKRNNKFSIIFAGGAILCRPAINLYKKLF